MIWAMVSTMASSSPFLHDLASRWSTTSVSMVVWKMEPVVFQFLADLSGVDEVSVVGDGKGSSRILDPQGAGH